MKNAKKNKNNNGYMIPMTYISNELKLRHWALTYNFYGLVV